MEREKTSLPDPYTGKEAFGLFSNLKLEIYSLYALAFLGLSFRLFYPMKNNMTGTTGPASITIWGYGLSFISLLCILFIVYGLSKKELMESKNFNPNIKDGLFNNLKYILGEGNIFVMIIIVIMLILLLNFTYYEKINVGIIPESFPKFNYVSNLLMLIQFIILFQFINLKILQGKNSPIIGIIRATTYLLSTANIIFVIIMYILLKYYSTDG